MSEEIDHSTDAAGEQPGPVSQPSGMERTEDYLERLTDSLVRDLERVMEREMNFRAPPEPKTTPVLALGCDATEAELEAEAGDPEHQAQLEQQLREERAQSLRRAEQRVETTFAEIKAVVRRLVVIKTSDQA